MDATCHNLGFAANPQPNAFKNLCNSIQLGGSGADIVYSADTTLRLDSPTFANPFTPAQKGIKRKWGVIGGSVNHLVDSSLNLRLGHSSSSSESKGSTATACTSMSKETEEESSMDIELDFTLHLGSDNKSSGPEKPTNWDLKSAQMAPVVDLQLSLSSGSSVSDITLLHPTPPTLGNFSNTYADLRKTCPISWGFSSSMITTPKSSVTCTSGTITTQPRQVRSSSTKQCQHQGCSKGARGASGLCIAHGGGRRCQRPDCGKGAEGRTAFCKAHGGGRRCEFLGCTKSAEGHTDFCIAHGGGRRCSYEGCTKAARGKSGLCIRHGGGKRCQAEGCSRSAEGLSGLCISHGGGRRCQHPGCSKGAQGSTMFCKAHGGGKRCTHPGCDKGAEGSTLFCKGHGGGKRCSFEGGGVCPKSVHGGTLYCVAHGGGKRCAASGCTKSARGRTDFCVRHGGGKRCTREGCGKSAQGSTDFCKAHGGGRRCMWGHVGCEHGAGKVPCGALARGRTGLCVSHGSLVQDSRVHGGATVRAGAKDSDIDGKSLFVSDSTNLAGVVAYAEFGSEHGRLPVGSNNVSTKLPEGRVHGGNLMAIIGGNRGLGLSGSDGMAGPSEVGKSVMVHRAWM